MKALIISVGTGTRDSRKAIENLAEAIVKSIRYHKPSQSILSGNKREHRNNSAGDNPKDKAHRKRDHSNREPRQHINNIRKP
ncbi:MAG: hypothetical protein QW592_04175, partial [Candidatus Bathyarchaeia archaeon]